MEGLSISAVVLNVSVIADVVGSYLSEEDLKSCRSVSKGWYTWSSMQYRKKATFTVRNLNDLEKLVRHPDESYEASPFKQIIFKIKKMEGVKVARSMATFWNVHSTGLNFLKLKNVETCDKEILLDILYRRTPKLKTLILSNCFDRETLVQLLTTLEPAQDVQPKLSRLSINLPFDRFLSDEFKAELLSILLLIYPNLETLSVANYFCSFMRTESLVHSYSYLEYVLTKLEKVRSTDMNKYCLKTLDIVHTSDGDENQIELPFLKMLERLRFPLETLTLDFGGSISVDVVRGVLNVHKETLTKIAAYQTVKNVRQYGNFPFGVKLDSLKVLRVTDYLLDSMAFIEFVPNLEKLHVCDQILPKSVFTKGSTISSLFYGPNVIDRTNPLMMVDLQLRHLKEFRCDSVRRTTNYVKIVVHRWMPNLQNFVTYETLSRSDLVEASKLFDNRL